MYRTRLSYQKKKNGENKDAREIRESAHDVTFRGRRKYVTAVPNLKAPFELI